MERMSSFTAFVCVFICFMASSEAYTFYAGGRDGWVPNPSESYDSWAGRNRFQVNDNIVFRYKKGENSVLVVSKEDYDSCNVNNPKQKLDGGDSTFTLPSSGPFYFISGNQDNCNKGQKLVVVVLATRGTTPTTTPSSSPPTPAQSTVPVPVPSAPPTPAAAATPPSQTTVPVPSAPPTPAIIATPPAQSTVPVEAQPPTSSQSPVNSPALAPTIVPIVGTPTGAPVVAPPSLAPVSGLGPGTATGFNAGVPGPATEDSVSGAGVGGMARVLVGVVAVVFGFAFVS